jgi:hypothetical protein
VGARAREGARERESLRGGVILNMLLAATAFSGTVVLVRMLAGTAEGVVESKRQLRGGQGVAGMRWDSRGVALG